jgi:tetratricopeptide (TPR) repeat protein
MKKKSLVIAMLAIVVVIIVAAAVWSPIKQNLSNKDAMLAEDIDDSFSEWLYAEDDVKAEKEAAFMGLIENAVNSKGASYAGQRGLFIRGQYYVSQKEWEKASADYAMLAERYPKSYLAPVSLFNAASTLEEAGNTEEAVLFYAELLEKYGKIAPEAAEALFNLARLSEEKGDKVKAKEYYEQLITDYSSSDWKNIAKTRILIME